MKISEIVKLMKKYPYKVMPIYEYSNIREEFIYGNPNVPIEEFADCLLKNNPEYVILPQSDNHEVLNYPFPLFRGTYYQLISYLKENGMPNLCKNTEDEHLFIYSIYYDRVK